MEDEVTDYHMLFGRAGEAIPVKKGVAGLPMLWNAGGGRGYAKPPKRRNRGGG